MSIFPPKAMAAPADADGAAASAAPPGAFASNVASLPSADRRERLRSLEALLFAASEPLTEEKLASLLNEGGGVGALLDELRAFYGSRGVNLVKVAGKWAFRTADDLSHLLERHARAERRLSRAALETLSIVAYHQPVTRAEIEEIRGVATSKGTLDALLETGWIRLRGRRRAPGRPVTYGTTESFLVYFGLESVKDLPGLSELKGAGLLDGNLPEGFQVPEPNGGAELTPDEMPLDAAGGAFEESLAFDEAPGADDPAPAESPSHGGQDPA